jgi:hypothetical protein
MQLAFMCQRNNLTSTQFPFYINLFQGHPRLVGLFSEHFRLLSLIQKIKHLRCRVTHLFK